MNIAQSLKSLSGYPINTNTIENIIDECSLNSEAEMTAAIRASTSYIKAKAMVYQYLAIAPNVSQQGITYNFSAIERKELLAKADKLLDEDEIVGYIGEDL